jgi:hypothetical protein
MFEQNTYFMSSNFFSETHVVSEIMWNYHTAGQATDDNDANARCVMEEYVLLTAFHGNNGYANAPLCYVIRTMSVG